MTLYIPNQPLGVEFASVDGSLGSSLESLESGEDSIKAMQQRRDTHLLS